MTGFQERFEDRLPSLESAIKDMPGTVEDIIPGLTKERIIRLFRRVSVLLGKIDSNKVKHPQYLWMNGALAPESVIGLVDKILSNSAAGASAFVQNSLYGFLNAYDTIERAVGTDTAEIKKLLSSVNSDLSIAVARTDELSSEAKGNLKELQEAHAAAMAAHDTINQLLDATRADAAKADEARRVIQSLTNPDGRSKASLETLAKRARDRIAEIEDIFTAAGKELENAAEKSREAAQLKNAADAVMNELNEKKTEAENILNLSSQAGLAASYQKESMRLEYRHLAYSCIIYLTSIAAFLVAICYVIPSLGEALEKVGQEGHHLDFWQALSFTLLRASVLAPLVYVIYFTQKTIASVELLRMDYAEKAAASLAYSGYKEQMEVDPDLLKQLKSSLLQKFSEHPERLLNKDRRRSRAKLRFSQFEAEANSDNQGDEIA